MVRGFQKGKKRKKKKTAKENTVGCKTKNHLRTLRAKGYTSHPPQICLLVYSISYCVGKAEKLKK